MDTGIKESIFGMLVGDEMPKGKTLEEHDRQHHHGHYDPSTQRCKFRERMMEETDTDKADIVEEGKVSGTGKPFEDEFGEGFWEGVYGKGGKSYSSRYSVKWDETERADAKAAAEVLKGILGGVEVELADSPFEGEGGGETMKSISGIFTGSTADYANRSRQGGVDDGPSVKHIGTGEGSQVYGWGLYGSTERGVAEGYANPNGRISDVLVNGKRHKAVGVYEVVASMLKNGDAKEFIKDTLGALDEMQYALDESGKSSTTYGIRTIDQKYIDKRRAEIKEAQRIINEGATLAKPGNVYEQTFFTDRAPGDESHLLKWYDAISDANWDRVIAQAEKEGLREKLKGAWWLRFNGDLEHFITDNGNSGDAIYESLSRLLGSPQAASEFLYRAGIDGIKYPVDSYGGKGVKDGDKVGWNYVAFSADNIRVDHKWVDGEQRYFKNPAGKVVGEYDRATGRITLYPGATAKDVVHEYSHGLWQFAEEESKAGRTGLLDKIKEIGRSAPASVKEAVFKGYEGERPEVLLEECFTHEMARRSAGNEAFAEAVRTAAGKAWYRKAWGAIKDIWKGFARKAGLNKADITRIDEMSAGEAADHILRQMAQGRHFGEIGAGVGRRAARTFTEDGKYINPLEGGKFNKAWLARALGGGGEEGTDIGYSAEDIKKGLGGLINGRSEGAAQKVLDETFKGDCRSRFKSMIEGPIAKQMSKFGEERVGNSKRFMAAVAQEGMAKYPKVKEMFAHTQYIPTIRNHASKRYGVVQGELTSANDGGGKDMLFVWGWIDPLKETNYLEEHNKEVPWVIAHKTTDALNWNRATVMHEIGHMLQYKMQNSKQWNSIVKADATGWSKRVSEYGNTHKDELHSECLAYYTMGGYKKGTLPQEVEEFLEKELRG